MTRPKPKSARARGKQEVSDSDDVDKQNKNSKAKKGKTRGKADKIMIQEETQGEPAASMDELKEGEEDSEATEDKEIAAGEATQKDDPEPEEGEGDVPDQRYLSTQFANVVVGDDLSIQTVAETVNTIFPKLAAIEEDCRQDVAQLANEV